MAGFSAHTTRVIILRWILPVFAIVTLIGVITLPVLKEYEISKLSASSKTALKVKDVSLTLPKDGKQMELQVSRPEYSGLDEENRPYLITADRVIQKGLQANTPMTLEKPVATVTVDAAKDQKVQIDGSTGVYDPANKTLQLSGPVTVTHTEGYVMNLEELFADVTKGYMISNHPVTGNGPGGTLQGESMEIRNRGNDIILKGRSKVTLIPKEE